MGSLLNDEEMALVIKDFHEAIHQPTFVLPDILSIGTPEFGFESASYVIGVIGSPNWRQRYWLKMKGITKSANYTVFDPNIHLYSDSSSSHLSYPSYSSEPDQDSNKSKSDIDDYSEFDSCSEDETSKDCLFSRINIKCSKFVEGESGYHSETTPSPTSFLDLHQKAGDEYFSCDDDPYGKGSSKHQYKRWEGGQSSFYQTEDSLRYRIKKENKKSSYSESDQYWIPQITKKDLEQVIPNPQKEVLGYAEVVSIPLVHSSNNPIAPKYPGLDVRGQVYVSKMDILSEQIFYYHSNVSQAESDLYRKFYLKHMIYYTISPIFPNCGLYIVGSSLNGFGNNGSDMDLCLMLTNKEMDQRKDAVPVLNSIKSKMDMVEWVENLQLIVAKVPILRITFKPPFNDITVDLNANNAVAIRNTHLLCAYSNFDWRVRPLVSVVKEWAKKRGMNDANKSTFTSYSLVLMCIHYLQSGADCKILPSLQEMFPNKFNNKCDVRHLNVAVSLDISDDRKGEFCSDMSLGELLVGFLKYYATKFDYDEDAISVRLGSKVTRKDVLTNDTPHNIRSQWRCICIEEPFTHLNTAHSVYDIFVFKAIKNCFLESYQTLERTRDFNLFLNGPTIMEELGMYVLTPPGGVFFNNSKHGSNVYSQDSDFNSEEEDRKEKKAEEPTTSIPRSGSENVLTTKPLVSNLNYAQALIRNKVSPPPRPPKRIEKNTDVKHKVLKEDKIKKSHVKSK